MKIKSFLSSVFISLLFLFISIITIKDYGINWDEPFHFARGQAFLRYMTTGKIDYLDLPAYSPKPKGDSDFMDQFGIEMQAYVEAPKSNDIPGTNIRRSFFQSDVWTYAYLEKYDIYGHPGINDLLAAGFNQIFYQKLNIVGDIESYHLFEVVSSFLLILAVGVFTYNKFGSITSIVSTLVLSSYPLFFSESHFNIKDPVVAAFSGLTIILFCLGIDKQDYKKIIMSSVFFALALGTKFNILFIVPILVIYAAFKLRKIFYNKKVLVSIVLYPIMSFSIFYLLSPNLWQNTAEKLIIIFTFYKEIGLGTPPELSQFLIEKYNFFAFYWFLITTQIPYLLLGGIGFISSFYKFFREKKPIYLLIIYWFLVPFIRVTLPNTNIYGGIRQIMEFIPAFSILAGLGAKFIYEKSNKSIVALIVFFIFILFSVYEMIAIHPNQNVYFNQIIGGLSGAKEKNIPYWGNSYGNVYLQGLNWLNKNAPIDSKLALPINTPYHIPRLRLRKDIAFSNGYLSGGKHLGEYVMENYFDWSPMNWYRYSYYNTFFNPVYELKIDGVALLKIWKNSTEYLREGYKEQKKYTPNSIEVVSNEITKNIFNKKMIIDLGQEVNITKLTVYHSRYLCDLQKPGFGYVALSLDKKIWVREAEDISYPQEHMSFQEFDENTLTYLFAAKKARYILLDSQIDSPCILKNPQIEVMGLIKTI